jgi:hypothetical protein
VLGIVIALKDVCLPDATLLSLTGEPGVRLQPGVEVGDLVFDVQDSHGQKV